MGWFLKPLNILKQRFGDSEKIFLFNNTSQSHFYGVVGWSAIWKLENCFWCGVCGVETLVLFRKMLAYVGVQYPSRSAELPGIVALPLRSFF